VSLDEPLGTVDRDLQICDKNHKPKNLPRQHLPPSSHNFLKALFCHTLPSLWMASNPKSRGGGCKFSVVEKEHLLDVVEEVVPIRNPDWERISQEHLACYPTKERTEELLKRKFQELACKKNAHW
jgi:hypothetical protein